MALINQDFADAFQRKDISEEVQFTDLWPSETKGDGRVVANNRKTGSAQGKASFVRKAQCRLCGFPLDLNQNDHTGGSLDGKGAGGAIATATATATFPTGITHTEAYGSQSYSKGAGCPLCFSKNSTKDKIDADMSLDPWSRIAPLGF